jgi:hypothetical protein
MQAEIYRKKHKKRKLHLKNLNNGSSSVRSNRTRKNIEILKKFGSSEAMFNSVRFDSVGDKSSRVSLYPLTNQK